MTICPDCGHENIEGVDECAECQQPLSPLDLPSPATELERSILTDRIASLVPREPLMVDTDAPVSIVLRLLVAHAVGCVIVMEDGEPVGIFSERDALLRLGADAQQLGDQPISNFMTPGPQMLNIHDKIAYALQRMDAGGYRHIPVTDDDRITGIISVRDVLRYITGKLLVSQSV